MRLGLLVLVGVLGLVLALALALAVALALALTQKVENPTRLGTLDLAVDLALFWGTVDLHLSDDVFSAIVFYVLSVFDHDYCFFAAFFGATPFL